MAWWYAVIEGRHELQNPTSPEKIRLLGERLGLDPSSRVLDVASGKGGPARILADEFGCWVTCVERSPEFAEEARRRATGRIDVIEEDATTFEYEPGAYDAALCLGASFVYGGPVETLNALRPAVPSGGFVAVGEPYWRRWPLPPEFEVEEGEGFLPLRETVQRFESAGVEVVTLIASSQDDWDRYETLHWLALAEWLKANPNDPDADAFRERGRHHKDRYLRWIRDLMGWAIFLCRT
jgi:SAM-dependent methyltransferase